LQKGNAALDLSQQFPVILADPPWRYENPDKTTALVGAPLIKADEIRLDPACHRCIFGE
jgi:hypothetical protein